MLRSTGTSCVALLLALQAPGALADAWVKGMFTQKRSPTTLEKPLVIESLKNRFELIQEKKKAQPADRPEVTYIIDKNELRDGTAAARQISKGNLCDLDTKVPHLSGYNVDQITYVIPCKEPTIPHYQLR